MCRKFLEANVLHIALLALVCPWTKQRRFPPCSLSKHTSKQLWNLNLISHETDVNNIKAVLRDRLVYFKWETSHDIHSAEIFAAFSADIGAGCCLFCHSVSPLEDEQLKIETNIRNWYTLFLSLWKVDNLLAIFGETSVIYHKCKHIGKAFALRCQLRISISTSWTHSWYIRHRWYNSYSHSKAFYVNYVFMRQSSHSLECKVIKLLRDGRHPVTCRVFTGRCKKAYQSWYMSN